VRGGARVVELIGPAGVGKSTLARRLAAGDPQARAPLGLWGLPLPALLAHVLRLVPTWLAAWWGRRPLRWPEVTQMIRLGALHDVVARQVRRGNHIVLDEGPIFGLSWFLVFFPERDRTPGFARWRAALLARCAATVEAVVFLDASDAVLARRVRERSKPHMAKHWDDEQIFAFNARFREAFGRVLADLGRYGEGPPVLRHRVTGDEPAETLAEQLRTILTGEGDGR